jgi:hypothetical protein
VVHPVGIEARDKVRLGRRVELASYRLNVAGFQKSSWPVAEVIADIATPHECRSESVSGFPRPCE